MTYIKGTAQAFENPVMYRLTHWKSIIGSSPTELPRVENLTPCCPNFIKCLAFETAKLCVEV